MRLLLDLSLFIIIYSGHFRKIDRKIFHFIFLRNKNYLTLTIEVFMLFLCSSPFFLRLAKSDFIGHTSGLWFVPWVLYIYVICICISHGTNHRSPKRSTESLLAKRVALAASVSLSIFHQFAEYLSAPFRIALFSYK